MRTIRSLIASPSDVALGLWACRPRRRAEARDLQLGRLHAARSSWRTSPSATGIETEMSVHATNEEIMGKLTASGGQGFDVVFVSSPFAEALHKQGWVAEIDHSKIPNLKNLYRRGAPARLRPGQQILRPLYLGHHRPVLPRRPRQARARRAGWTCSSPTDDLKGKITMPATDRWLLAAGCLRSAIRSTPPTRPNRRRQGAADRSQEEPARL